MPSRVIHRSSAAITNDSTISAMTRRSETPQHSFRRDAGVLGEFFGDILIVIKIVVRLVAFGHARVAAVVPTCFRIGAALATDLRLASPGHRSADNRTCRVFSAWESRAITSCRPWPRARRANYDTVCQTDTTLAACATPWYQLRSPRPWRPRLPFVATLPPPGSCRFRHWPPPARRKSGSRRV